jgi:Predicted lactoylglutathione lyase
MTKELWLNLPVKDLKKTKEFFTRIGFKPNEEQSNDEMVCFEVGEKGISVVFFTEDVFRSVSKSDVSDTSAGAEALISFDVADRAQVDETARKVFEAGGKIFSEPAEYQGGMYAFGFADPSGHRWNVVHMNFSENCSN